MRRNHGIVFVVLVVALVFSALGSAVASASSWYSGGTVLTSSAALNAKTTRTSGVRFSFSGVEIECEGIELKNADIVPSAGGQIEHLVFTGCHSLTKNCILSSKSIESKPLSIEAALGGKSPEDTLLLKPVSGTTFLEFTFEGESCGFAGRKVATGHTMFTFPKGREEAVEQGLNINAPPIETLKMGNLELVLRGEVKVELASGKDWSFH